MPDTGLGKFVANWKPGAVRTFDDLACEQAQRLAATLDVREEFREGKPLPALWHWAYFTEWPPTTELGADGHPSDGHFLPPIPHRRRMFAGGRFTMLAPMLLGQRTERQSELTAVTIKEGRTGEMLFVTLLHEYRQGGQLCAAEELDLVYRSVSDASAPFVRANMALPDRARPWVARPKVHPPMLFRFSALTANAHRIHYDAGYATGTEGFPGLVVPGPLLALYMAELLRANAAGRSAQSFTFRLSSPVFVDDSIHVEGRPSGDVVELLVVSGAGVHASAKAVLK